ncbi:Homogentisate 1,2-dioxygenase [Gaertneriomyces semiglobifer]|nr:Homogentisate 1,2-dioxygenase [Gaertneriomyces semiglobifer]
MSKAPAYKYLSGFGNQHSTEALEGALPEGQNSPQKCSYGLYAEQLSGSAFTAPRHDNLRSWLYRIRPSVCHTPYTTAPSPGLVRSFAVGPDSDCQSTPNQLRWSPFELPKHDGVDFVSGLRTVCGSGDPSTRSGLAILVYLANADMSRKAFYNADGEMLIVPQQGALHIQTEMGYLYVEPNEIAVIPRGVRFSVKLPDGPSRGYILEVFDRRFELPDLGPIGANGLANPRDFLYPTAAYEDIDNTSYEITGKFQGQLFRLEQSHSPFDVVAWHGNYAPYKYDLRKFCTVNTVSFDHPDPSIFTVLTCKSANPGTALADFVIFPPRWMVGEHTFRPPYYHRNCMSEFMGLISGGYDAKAEGFLPGGASLHSIMSPHGPDQATFDKASTDDLKPVKLRPDGLAFMFETCHTLSLSRWALQKDQPGGKMLQDNYYQCWTGLKKYFDPTKKEGKWGSSSGTIGGIFEAMKNMSV